MPANARSLTLTDAYRSRLLALGDRVEAQARQRWPTIEQLDETDWPEAMATSIARAQTEGVRLSAGYLTAFLRSETGRGTARAIDSRAYAGLSRDGRPLNEALISPLIGTRKALKDGKTSEEALQIGLERGLPNINLDVLHAARSSLNDLMEAEERVVGWQRGVKGTCGACGGDIAVEVSVQLPGVPLMVHPNCQCTTVPVVTPKSQVSAKQLNGWRASVHNMGRSDYTPPAVRVDPDLAEEAIWSAGRGEIVTAARGTAAEQRSTMLHELGHAVDDRLPWTADDYAEIQAAINASRAIRAIPREWPKAYSDYMVDPSEAWARSYAQWMAGRLGDRAALAEMRSLGTDIHWDDDDFRAIAEAIERVFRRRGWMD